MTIAERLDKQRAALSRVDAIATLVGMRRPDSTRALRETPLEATLAGLALAHPTWKPAELFAHIGPVTLPGPKPQRALDVGDCTLFIEFARVARARLSSWQREIDTLTEQRDRLRALLDAKP